MSNKQLAGNPGKDSSADTRENDDKSSKGSLSVRKVEQESECEREILISVPKVVPGESGLNCGFPPGGFYRENSLRADGVRLLSRGVKPYCT